MRGRELCVAGLMVAWARPLPAQAKAADRWMLFAAYGPSEAAREVDAAGVQGTFGVDLFANHPFNIRLAAAHHHYPDVSLYPCLVQDANRCYQTMRRDVNAYAIDAVYRPGGMTTANTRFGVYLLAGIGRYDSRRIATRYSDCQPTSSPCDRTRYEWTRRGTQPAVNGGVGVEAYVEGVRIFLQGDVHYVRRTSPQGTPTNDYWLVPVSIGVRL